MHSAPIRWKNAQTAHTKQNGTYFRNAPNVYDNSMPATMKNWNTVPKRPASIDVLRIPCSNREILGMDPYKTGNRIGSFSFVRGLGLGV